MVSYTLTSGIDLLTGTMDGDTFEARAVHLNADDRLDGGGGNDQLLLVGSGVGSDFFLDALAGFTSIETIRGSSGSDTLYLTAQQLAGLALIDGGEAGDDRLMIRGATIDLSQVQIAGFEEIRAFEPEARMLISSKGFLGSMTGIGSTNQSVVLLEGSFSGDERLALNRRGIDTIIDKTGSTTHLAPQVTYLNGDHAVLTSSSPVFLDAGRDARLECDDDRFLALNLGVEGWSPQPHVFGIDPSGGITLSAGMNPGSTIALDEIVFGSIESFSNGQLGILFNGNASTARVQALIRSLTYDDGAGSLSTPTGIIMLLHDAGGRESVSRFKVIPENYSGPDINHAPSDITLSNGTIAVGAADNAEIGQLAALDADENDASSFTLYGAVSDMFKIEGNRLLVADASKLDAGPYGVNAYAIRVQVQDGAGEVHLKDFVITVTDGSGEPDPVNSAPVIHIAPGASITRTSDNGPDAAPFSGVSFDDAQDDTLTVSIAFDQSHGSLTADGHLIGGGAYTLQGSKAFVNQTIQALRFNPTDRAGAAVGAEDVTTFSITAFDSAGLTATDQSVQVISSAANRAPFDMNLSQTSLRELPSNGAVVGSFSTLDHNAGEQFSYRLLDDAGGRFRIDGDTLIVAEGIKLDFEQAASHQIGAEVTDAHGARYARTFTIAVQDWQGEVTGGTDASDRIKGGLGNDRLGGGRGNDMLSGGVGKDTLTGHSGRDVFLFDAPLTRKNMDRITDFNVKDDSIQLDAGLFKSNKAFFSKIRKASEAKPIKLKKDFFAVGQASDGNDHFLVDPETRTLSYDPDGSGAKPAAVIAIFARTKALKGFSEKDLFFV